MLFIESNAEIPIRVPNIRSQNEPTAAPDFQFTTLDSVDPAADAWVTGSWSGTWNATTGTGQTAITPLTGSAGFELDGNQKLWIRWVAGAHTFVTVCGSVHEK